MDSRLAGRSVLLAVALTAAIAVAGCAGATDDGGGGTEAEIPSALEAPADDEETPGVEIDEGESRDLCTLITADDFAAAGIDGAGTPERGTDDFGSSFCVYAGRSGATGGIEFDAFPNEDEATAKQTFATATGEGPGGQPPAGAAFDESAFAIDGEVAYLTARQGRLVISFAVPNDTNVEAGLVQLATLAFERSPDLQ